MSSQATLESVGYLLWAAGFLALTIGLAVATASYRRMVHRQDR
ncbi:hypothetical protein SAMN02745126_04935 [Enhydrobacter aerosaccus]|uniref:Heme exporter protein D n=1 Tax=Enhydrobacter aerosaccus TaxID=225324 RepID=A0A1T4SPU6_9HYPH|nr:hypothetical protein [Enhydrobacter aerosaccus]SKA30304.1 hypothetical protein SAMN02745126_04935 [Enhydrobacter aerosaccus]